MLPIRNILVTSALPYANGSIHIGHLVEYIQTDIWVRFQKLRGHQVLYVCGDDSHGTPIMLKAREAGVTPEAHIAFYLNEHQQDFAKFSVAFDNYHTTHSELNKELSYDIYERVKKGGHLIRKDVEQLYDPVEKIFLPDRFITGTCPHCKSPDQYGDSCEVCGKTFDPADLIDPKSVISGATPVTKSSEHIFLDLEKSRTLLLKLIETDFVDPAVKNKLLEWFSKEVETETDGQKSRSRVEAPLRPWDITRDAPFFGFAIPGEKDKYLYNWFDAPIGYLASLGDKLGISAALTQEYWNQRDLEIHHFIGKDIQYFHAMFWPAMLQAAGLRVPTRLAIHGFLQVNGKKMSKRDGTFIKASAFAKHLDPQALRYYYATKLTGTPEDLDLNFDDFQKRVDSELVGKLANLFSRSVQFLITKMDGQSGVVPVDALPLLNEIRSADDSLAGQYEALNFAAATRQICALADKVNKYVEDQAPWALLKKGDAEGARAVCTAAMECGRILTIYLKPILPAFAAKVEKSLNLRPLEWKHVQDAMPSGKVGAWESLASRVDVKQVQAMIEETKEQQTSAATAPAVAAATIGAPAATAAPPAAPGEEPLAPTIDINQFMAVDLRVGRVLVAEPVPNTDKMMKITMDAGPLGQRTIFAGIKQAYTAEKLTGRLVIFCANLAPRKMKFGTSEGMICASGPGGAEVFVLSPDAGAKPGQRVH